MRMHNLPQSFSLDARFGPLLRMHRILLVICRQADLRANLRKENTRNGDQRLQRPGEDHADMTTVTIGNVRCTM